jgi:hypothetical protein
MSEEKWVKDDVNLAQLATDFHATIPGPDPWEDENGTKRPNQ